MLHVDDLQLEAEVLPLFNYTYTAESEAVVRQLLRELPPSIELVEDKQRIIQGFLANWTVLADFSYPKIHLQEVRAFLQAVGSGQIVLETNRAKMAAKLLFSEEERYKTRAKYVQVILFLRRVQQHYLSRLDLAAFPVSFQPQLMKLMHFLERFALADSAQAIQEGAFSAARMVHFARQLRAVTSEQMTEFWEVFCRFEAYWSIAKGIQEMGFAFPVFREEGLQLVEFYHPVLRQPVKNTLVLGHDEHVVMLTGPNMSGKSTLLKAVGLCVYLAHAGLAVPAAACELPFFHSLVVAINLRDSLRDGYSHFMAEIQNLKEVLRAAREPGRTFAIFDELFRGTNVDDALEITRATVSGLASFPRSYFFISTHLLQLEHQLPTQLSTRPYCIECVLQDGLPMFSYRLQAGWSNLKIGRLLFQKEGLYSLLERNDN